MSMVAVELVDIARLLRREFDRRATAIGVTRAQWRVLSRLAKDDGQRQIDLADVLDVDPITMCRMLDRLAEAQLIERRRDERDRRAWRIHLTEKSQPIVEELRVLGDRFHTELLAGIPDDDMAVVGSVLARMRENLDSGAAARIAS